jgi:hypothetical protein
MASPSAHVGPSRLVGGQGVKNARKVDLTVDVEIDEALVWGDRKAVEQLARSHTVRAVEVLASLMESSEDDKTRMSAAKALVEIGWGRPRAGKESAVAKTGLTINVIRHTDPEGERLVRQIEEAKVAQPKMVDHSTGILIEREDL